MADEPKKRSWWSPEAFVVNVIFLFLCGAVLAVFHKYVEQNRLDRVISWLGLLCFSVLLFWPFSANKRDQ